MDYRIALQTINTATTGEGQRVLVDRHRPAGPRWDPQSVDDWCPEAAPDDGLQQDWLRGQLDRPTFEARYRLALLQASDSLLVLMRLARQGPLTLLTANGDPEHSHLPMLRQALLEALHQEDREADGHELSSPVCYEPRNS